MAPLVELIDNIKSEKFRHVHSVLIVKNGKLVLEEYFYGHTSNDIHEIRSVFKTLTSALIGIAIDKRFINAVDQSIFDFFPEYESFDNWDDRKKGMIIEHLLSMSSGLDNNDWDNAIGGEMRMKNQTNQPDWIKLQLDLPMVNVPGEKFAYSSGGVNILSGIISNASNVSVTEFIDRYLFQPLEINDFSISHAPNGQEYLAGDVYLRPRDTAKFAQLYLDNGSWRGNQVISKGWVDKSTKKYFEQRNYGYLWWLPSFEFEENEISYFYVNGTGGQSIVIIPELEMVIVFTGGNFNIDLFENIELVRQYIIPSVLEN